MIVDIETRRLCTILAPCPRVRPPLAVGLRAFVKGNDAVDFPPRDRNEAYAFVRDTLERFGYRRLSRRDKGAVLRVPRLDPIANTMTPAGERVASNRLRLASIRAAARRLA